jgi:hypothetical protein
MSDILRWLSADEKNVVGGSRYRPPTDAKDGKVFRLEAVWEADPPKRFTVCEWHDSFVAHLRKKWRNRPFEPTGDRLVAVEVKDRPGFSQGDKLWTLPGANPVRGKRVFKFTDEDTGDLDVMPSSWSPKLTSCRFGDVFVGLPEIEAKGFTVKLGINGVVRASVDPPVRLTLMTPWGQGAADLVGYMEEYVGTLQRQMEAADLGIWGRSGLQEAFPGLLSAAPPEGLEELSLSTDLVHASPEVSGDFRIEMRVRRPFSTMLAVRAVSDDDEADFVVSDVLPLNIPAASEVKDPLRRRLELLQPEWAQTRSRPLPA